MKIINFRHKYHKLKDLQFHTIRSKKDYKIGEIVDIHVRDEFVFQAQIYQTCSAMLKYLPYEFVKKDIEYRGFETSRKSYRKDLIELLNSFYPRTRFSHLKIHFDSRIDILNLTKIFDEK